MNITTNRALAILALLLAVFSVFSTGYPLLTIAVILLAIAVLI